MTPRPRPRHRHLTPLWDQRSERGSATIWAILLIAGAFTVLLGLVVDGGHLVESRLSSSRTAAQAARVGADALSESSVRSGRDRVAAAAAARDAQEYLRNAGMQGTVRVAGDTVAVTVTGRSDTKILGVMGIESFPIRETQTARGITEEDQP